ncbi:MAG: hypothetical protein V4485_04340, partial [Pseudomonadota bacterium]
FFDGSGDLNEEFIRLAGIINKEYCPNHERSLPENYEESKKAVLDLLSSKNDWLLVFDNIKIDQNDKLKDIVNWHHNGHVILCAQDSRNLPQAIPVPHLSDLDASDLTKHILNNPDPDLTKELVRIFKGYPLLVAQSAIFLNDNKYITPQEYANILRASDDKVTAHVSLILDQLSESSKNLLYKIAMIDNHRFSRGLLEVITDNKQSLPEDIYNIARFGLVMNSGLNKGEV